MIVSSRLKKVWTGSLEVDTETLLKCIAVCKMEPVFFFFFRALNVYKQNAVFAEHGNGLLISLQGKVRGALPTYVVARSCEWLCLLLHE